MSSNGYITREELDRFAAPPGTKTHRPIKHLDYVNAVIDTLGLRNIAVVKEQHAVSPDGMNYFGVMEIEKMHAGCRYAFGLRNSNKKEFALGITLGFRVTNCDNLLFSGDYSPLMRKHTSNVNLNHILSVAIDDAQRNFTSL